VNPLPTFSYEISGTQFCIGEEIVFTEYFTGTPPWTVDYLYNGLPGSFTAYNNPELYTIPATENAVWEPLTVTDGNGCSSPVNQPVTITVNPLPTFTYEISDNEVCYSDEVVFTYYFTGTAPWTVEFLDNGVLNSFTTSENPQFYTQAMYQTMVYEPFQVTDGNGCSSAVNQVSTIVVNPLPQLSCPPFMEAIVNEPPVLLNSVTPEGGMYAGIGVTFNGTDYFFDPSIGVGTYQITYCYYDPITACGNCCDFNFIVKPIQGDEQVICIPQGWSAISSYYTPDNPLMSDVFAELNVGNKVSIVLGESGLYWPSQNINTIGNWDVKKGYKIKMNEAACLEIEGEFPENRTITPKKGISYIPVLCTEPVSATVIFSQFGLNLQYSFDIYSGQIFWPAGGLYTLQYLEPGIGYLVSLSAQSQATFECSKSSPENYVKAKPKNYYNAPWKFDNTGVPHFVSLNGSAFAGITPGDYLGVFNANGVCAGFTQFEGETENLLLVAYGDDVYTKSTDGLVENESMSFRIFRASENAEFPVEVTFDQMMPDAGEFAEYGQSKILKMAVGLVAVSENSLPEISVHPNPTHGLLYVESLSGESEVWLLDSRGQLIYSGSQNDNFTLNLEQYPTGIYTLKIVNNQRVATRKIVVE